MSRTYHYITAYYNYYFNAYDSYKMSIRRAEETYKYNFTMPLPVLLIGDSQVSGMVAGGMDRAIKKSTDLISKHSIIVKPERKSGVTTAKDKEFYNQTEFVKWAKESWILIGKSQTWKGSYDDASQTLEHILLQYPNTSIWFEAQLWLARISIIRADYVNAEDKLKTVESNKKRPTTKSFRHLLASTWAFYYTKQSMYKEAISPLKKALQNCSSKGERLRYNYLLAQISQRLNKNEDALAFYKKVLKMNPSYEMAFNAQIGIASSSNETGEGRDMKKLLVKLSKDAKNKDYLDQIYYTLGNIEKAEGNTEKSIEYFKLSASKSSGNNYQKGLSYLTLADYYFAKPNYTQSEAYYDSAFNSLDETYFDYKRLETKTRFLNKLVENLNTINREDSLQRVAKMSSTDRDNLIAGLIAKIQEEEQKKLAEETEDRQRSIQYQQNQRYQQTEVQSGKWYFYNQAQLSFGQSEFQMKWGKRKLEDNWRRKNRRITSGDFIPGGQQNTADTSKTPQKIISNKSKEFYLQDLPTTDSLIKISNQKILESMFKVGEVYQNDLKDYSETILAYEKFTDRFPDSPYTLQAFYNLYQVSVFTNNDAGIEKYKNIIISRFPTSTYAIMLTNPNYLKELSEKQNEEGLYYQDTYSSYLKGDYAQAIVKIDQGLKKYPNSKLEPQFDLLKSLCVGKTADLRTFRESLDELVKKYPKTDVAETATTILEFMRRQELQLAMGQTNDSVKVADTTKAVVKTTIAYKKPTGEHLFVALVPKKSNLNQLKFNIVSFNVDAFIEIDLSVNNQNLNEFFELIKVDKFKDNKQAMDYFKAASIKEGLFSPLKKEDYVIFIISQENFAIFLEDKSIADYLNFFKANYK